MEAPAQFIQAIMGLPWLWITGIAIVVALSWIIVGFLRRRMSVKSLEPYLSDYIGDIEGCDFEGKQGLMIIVGMKDVLGATIDARNMEEVALELDFAVVKIPSPNASRRQLRAMVEAVREFSFVSKAPSCKVILFYYAGHGGSDANKQPFVLTSDSRLNVEEIVSPLEPGSAPNLKDLRRLFFFDMCLGSLSDPGIRALQPKPTTLPVLKYAVPTKGNCLVAFSGSIGYAVRGDGVHGGYWTRHLFENLKENVDIHVVLAKTWKKTVKFTSELTKEKKIPQVQGPSFFSCMGPLNLKLGINEQEEERFERPRHESRSMPGPSMLRARGVNTDGDANSSHASRRSERVETDHDDDPNIGHLMKKEPQLVDLLNWLKQIQADWDKLGSQLKVQVYKMDNFKKDVGLDNGGRLSAVLEEWRKSLCSPHTFENLLSCLEKMDVKDCAKHIREQLQELEVQERYRSTPDYYEY